MATVTIVIDDIPITCVGEIVPADDGGRDYPSTETSWEWEDCLIGNQSMLGAEFMPWDFLEAQLIEDWMSGQEERSYYDVW